METERCKEMVSSESMGWHRHQCQRKAVIDGYCKQHHPDTVKARRDLSWANYRNQLEQSPAHLLAKAQTKIAELEEENQQLKDEIKNLKGAMTWTNTGLSLWSRVD